MTATVIIRAGVAYCGGPGYAGPACALTGIPPRMVYRDATEAREDAALLQEAAEEAYHGQPVEFVVVPHRERLDCPECGSKMEVTRRGYECVNAVCGLRMRFSEVRE